MLKINDKVGIVACSNPLEKSQKEQVDKLINVLKSFRLVPILSDCIFAEEASFYFNPQKRGEALMKFYANKEIKAVFDISGGDIANGVLQYLDYTVIKNNPKPFFGYSDLTTIINGIFTKTGSCTYLYQIKNLVGTNFQSQIKDFKSTVFENESNLYDIRCRFLQSTKMSGVVIGGNIRCFLKLAGTEYMPDFKDKILFLESFGGKAVQMTAFFTQLKQIGAFDNISGVVLGTFTAMEKEKTFPKAEDLLISIIGDKNLPIAKTEDIGHGSNSKCLIIGKRYEFRA